MKIHEANILPVLVIKDINGDGDTEVLFAPTEDHRSDGGGHAHLL